MRKWKWEGSPRSVPVAVLASRSHINHRHLALIREQRDSDPLSGASIVPFPESSSDKARVLSETRAKLPAVRTA